MLIADEPWICPQCGYEWVDPKDEWVDSESCEICKENANAD
jgi:rubrerythrin